MSKVNRVSVGGQALIEGILMRGPKGSAMALRMPDGNIEVEKKEFSSLRDKNKFFALPLIRGIVSFVESMIFGYQCLMESAEKVSFDEIKEDNGEEMSKVDRWITDHFGDTMVKVITVISTVLGVALSFGLFFYLPTIIVNFFNKLAGGKLDLFRAAIEGIIRIGIFILYMFLVSLMKDMKRMFMYHGAEHKSIFCYEAGKELTVENVREMSRFHPRCGTSFMFVMLIISIFLSSVISIAFPGLRNVTALWMIVKLLLLPVVMGIGFEFIRYAGCHDNKFVKIASAPGLWMQRITTKEPTDDIIEVGIASLNAALYGVEEKDEAETVSENLIDDVEETVSENAEFDISIENSEEEQIAVQEQVEAEIPVEDKNEQSKINAKSIVDDLFNEIVSDRNGKDK